MNAREYSRICIIKSDEERTFPYTKMRVYISVAHPLFPILVARSFDFDARSLRKIPYYIDDARDFCDGSWRFSLALLYKNKKFLFFFFVVVARDPYNSVNSSIRGEFTTCVSLSSSDLLSKRARHLRQRWHQWTPFNILLLYIYTILCILCHWRHTETENARRRWYLNYLGVCVCVWERLRAPPDRDIKRIT